MSGFQIAFSSIVVFSCSDIAASEPDVGLSLTLTKPMGWDEPCRDFKTRKNPKGKKRVFKRLKSGVKWVKFRLRGARSEYIFLYLTLLKVCISRDITLVISTI